MQDNCLLLWVLSARFRFEWEIRYLNLSLKCEHFIECTAGQTLHNQDPYSRYKHAGLVLSYGEPHRLWPHRGAVHVGNVTQQLRALADVLLLAQRIEATNQVLHGLMHLCARVLDDNLVQRRNQEIDLRGMRG